MFDKFGEFDSVEELNETAKGLLNEGDIESLKELADENGIDEEDVQDYIEGYSECLATEFMAAYGRLSVEEKYAKLKKYEYMAAKVIFTMTKNLCTSRSFCVYVMRKGKRVMDIYKAMKEEAGKHKNGNVGVSCGTDRELYNIIKAYYTYGTGEMKKLLDNLYK